jgi:hypothetical protein
MPNFQTTSTLTDADLAQFTGTKQIHKNASNTLCYTDGVQYMAQRAGAYWLLDAIASYQTQLTEPRLREFQIWILTLKNGKGLRPINDDLIKIAPKPNHDAILTCWADTPDDWHDWQNSPLLKISQDIQFTDFPLAQIKFYLCDTQIGKQVKPLLLLPSEY